MRLQIASDFHFEFRDDDENRAFIDVMPVIGDVLVLAGDVHLVFGLRAVMRQFAAKWPRVIAVAGEREYYHSDPTAVLREIMAIERELPNVAYLHNGSTITVSGQRFIGGTLWFPKQPDSALFADFNATHNFVFDAIYNFVPWVYETNQKTVKALRENLRADDVLVTHHLPSEVCVQLRHWGSLLNRFFVSPIDDIIELAQPKLAVCGHAHSGVNTSIGNTWIVGNPLGYPDEGKYYFDPAFVVEV